MSGVDRSLGDALRLPLHCESSHCTARGRLQLLKVAVGRPFRDSLVLVRARSHWVGRPAAGRFQAAMSRIKIQGPPGGCWCRLARQAEGNECVDHGCGSVMGGGERGQEAGLRFTPSGSGTSSSWTG